MSIARKCRILGLSSIWNSNMLLTLRNNHAFLVCVHTARRLQTCILLCTGYMQSTLQCILKTTILTHGIPVVFRKYIIKKYNSWMHKYTIAIVDCNLQLLHCSSELTDYILLLCIKIYSSVCLNTPFNKTLQFADTWLFPVTKTEVISETKRKKSIH